MGYNDAIQDGVRIKSQGKGGYTKYYPLCHICDAEVMSYKYVSGHKYTCKQCKLEMKSTDVETRQRINYKVKERKLENALKRFEKCRYYNTNKYEEAINKTHEILHTDGWFDSTEEIMVAIELVQKKIKFHHQVRFGRYRVDFVLPDLKIVLEVDGTIFHTDKTKDKEKIRDNMIILALGPEWEVIRITDEHINKNVTRLTQAIKKIMQQRNIQRKYNKGALPEWYNGRE